MGVVTIGALIGTRQSQRVDQARPDRYPHEKGGADAICIAKTPPDIHAVRIAAGEADLVLGCDKDAVNDYCWSRSAPTACALLNTYEAMPGIVATTRPDMQFLGAADRRGGRLRLDEHAESSMPIDLGDKAVR